MKSLWIVVFGLLVATFAAVFVISIYATVNDVNTAPSELAARKAQCRDVVRHLVEISPQRAGRSVDDAVAKIPVEDIEQCGAAYPESVTCMQNAADVAAVKNCIPAGVECKGPETVVQGPHAVYVVSGDCKSVVVRTTNALVVVKAKQPPTVRDEGTGNRIQK
ncbi:MAG TPA: hypothetical protein VLT45_01455 [Kofleriaceae bacterium]|nr:hypothetical protein [Kofleriaceae bacterium]